MNKIRALTGDSYLIDQKISALKSDFTKNNPNGVVENIDAESKSLSDINEILKGTTLFWSTKFIVIKNLTHNKDMVENIEQIIEDMPEDTSVIIREDNIDKRSKLYKLVKVSTKFTLEELTKPTNIQAWVKNTVHEQGGKINDNAVTILVQRAGIDPNTLNYEIKKLLYYDQNITARNVENLINENLESSIFELVNAIFTQDKKTALKIYENAIKSGAEVPAIIGMLAWQVHLIACVEISPKQIADLARDLKANPYTLSQTKNLSKNFDINKVSLLISKISDLDYRTKTEQIDKDQAMKNLIVSI